MIKKKLNQSEMRNAALKKENLRLQRKIFAQQAKIVTLQNELLLRPPFPDPQSGKPRSLEELNQYIRDLPSLSSEGGKSAA
jgi:hypothetical protein